MAAGCGGGGGGSSGPDKGALNVALARWGVATRAFDGQLTSCGRRVYPTRDFFATCMKQPPLGYMGAAAALRRSFDAGCKQGSAQAGRILTRDLALLRREIAAADEVGNAALERRPHRGPPAMQVEERASRTVVRDLAELRRLARGC
jgi:hypothetical protein